MPVEAKPLFRPDVLRSHLKGFELPDRVAAWRPQLTKWAELISTRKIDGFKEQELFQDFVSDLFIGVLSTS